MIQNQLKKKKKNKIIAIVCENLRGKNVLWRSIFFLNILKTEVSKSIGKINIDEDMAEAQACFCNNCI